MNERIDREIYRYSRRVDICFEDGWWAAYYGLRKTDPNDDEFTGWFGDREELLGVLFEVLPFRVYKVVEREAFEITAAA
jgi:hypothetical protein